MIVSVPHYYELVAVLADILQQEMSKPLKDRAETLVKQAGIEGTSVTNWLPVIPVPRHEWLYLNNERAVGVTMEQLMLVRVQELLRIYRKATKETELELLTAILNIKDYEWCILEIRQ